MVQNRYRIENEVLLGRQAVRRALRNREKSREAAASSPPEAITRTRLSQDGTDTGTVPTTSEAPMSMDTDAEDTFKKGSHRFSKRDTNKSGSLTPRERGTELKDGRHPNGLATQPLIWRGSRPSSSYTQGADHPLTATQPTTTEPTQQPGETVVLQPNPGIFSRIRRKSVLSSPFSTLRHTAARVRGRPASEHGVGDPQGSWSSDTSSDEDLPSPEWRHQFPSLDFEDVDDAPIFSSPDDEAESDGNTALKAAAEGAESDS